MNAKRAPAADAVGAVKIARPALRRNMPVGGGVLDDGYAVIVVERTGGADITPCLLIVVAVFRGAAKLLLGDAGTVSADPRVVFQGLPGQGIVVVAEAEEAAEAEHGIGHAPADLVDHHALDRADLVVVGTVHRGAFDLVAADQISELAFVDFSCGHSHRNPPCRSKEKPASTAIVPARPQPVGASPRSSGTMPEPGVFSASFSLGSRVASRVADFPGSLLCALCARDLSVGCSCPLSSLIMPWFDCAILLAP